jgi:hypothetical protein
MLGELSNFKKINLPECQLAKKPTFNQNKSSANEVVNVPPNFCEYPPGSTKPS